MKSRRKHERSRETNCNTVFFVQYVLFPWPPFIILFSFCFVFVSIFVFVNLLFCPCYCVCLCHVFVFAFAVTFPWPLSSFYLYLILSLLCLCLDRCLILPLSLCLHLGLFNKPLHSLDPLSSSFDSPQTLFPTAVTILADFKSIPPLHSPFVDPENTSTTLNRPHIGSLQVIFVQNISDWRLYEQHYP